MFGYESRESSFNLGALAMPKKAKGGGGGGEGKADKEKLPSEVEQMLQTKLNALQAKFDAQVREAEQSYAGRKEAARSLEKEQRDRKDNVAYLNAELSKKEDECAALQKKFVALQEEKDAQVPCDCDSHSPATPTRSLPSRVRC